MHINIYHKIKCVSKFKKQIFNRSRRGIHKKLTCCFHVLVLFLILALLQSCGVLVVPAIYLCKAFEPAGENNIPIASRSDVSGDQNKNYIVGKQYLLLKDCVMVKSFNEEQVHLTFLENNEDRSLKDDRWNRYAIAELVPKNTIITVTNIIAEGVCPESLNVLYILGSFNNELASHKSIDIKWLFSYPFCYSRKWDIKPKLEFLHEVGICSAIDKAKVKNLTFEQKINNIVFGIFDR